MNLELLWLRNIIIIKMLKIFGNFKSKSKYYLQNFENNEAVLTGGLHGFAESELKIWLRNKGKHSNIIVRGL